MNKRTKAALILICAVIIAAASVGCAESDTSGDSKPLTPVIEDYSKYFRGMKGSAVFLIAETGEYCIYNQELADMQTAPNSTFKIISCLMGLESGAIDPSDSTMEWDGTVYPIEDWNQVLDYKIAFKASAIWYYRKVVDLTGKDFVRETLDKLGYGNRDISQWEGNLDNRFFPDIKDLRSINGQESSLKISPVQQADVMYKIFHDRDVFIEQNIELAKGVMLTDSGNENVKLYGKTGTGIQDETWVNA
jgi:beta-lactamase class D